MTNPHDYVLGQTTGAARRLEIQDAHFGETSERLLDELAIRPGDRVVEFGCGPGGLSRRILRRLDAGGVLVGVDASDGFIAQARALLAGQGTGRFEPVLADIATLGPWIDGADVVVGRAVLHHVPMAECMLGRMRARLRPGSRVGFIEPDFRTLVTRIAYLEATGRPELAPLRVWAYAINHLYLANQISPCVGATLGQALAVAGYRYVRGDWSECRSDGMMIENMIMFYDEVRERLESLGLMTAKECDEQQRLLRALDVDKLPAAWATYRVACEV
jgi:SAM-dependent methyltransferase